MNIVAGPGQIGKSTMVRQVLQGRPANSFLSVSADPASDAVAQSFSSLHDDAVEVGVGDPRDGDWLVRCWKKARTASRICDGTFVLSIDEIQKIPQWSSVVKGLWDADRSAGIDMHVVLLGPSPLLVQKGLSESLAGRYELLPLTHWSFLEMREAFSFELEQYIYFGGYPGAADLISDKSRWRAYIRDSLATPSIDKDIPLLNRVDKPALLKQLFALGSDLSGQIVAYNRLIGELQDAGNTTTLARHLDLLGGAGLLSGLQKYSGSKLRQRTSPPKLQVLNNALMSVAGSYDFAAAQADRTYWGRLIESAVGAHLCNTASGNCQIRYWREGNSEVDFVIDYQGTLTAIEVKGILRANHGVPDPAAFLAEAKRRGIKELLANPQTLALLAEAVGPEGDWPATRGATYELACRKLVLDPNAAHRAATRTHAVAPDQLIDAAATLCAVLLLANQESVALDLAAAGEGWPLIADLGLKNSANWQAALATRLFFSDEDRRRPIHRSVAEYLAARHLAHKIDREGLSLRRVLALLNASDGGVVSDLRGVHAWLAAHCRTARTTLIDGDPLGVVLYGDAQSFTPDQKLRVLEALRREALRFPWFRHGHWFSHPFGALASPDMKEAFSTRLRADRRDRGSQAFLDCILEALVHGQNIGIDPALLVNIARDNSYFDRVRTSALQALFRQNPADPRAALALLDDIVAGTVEDGSDQLLGILLSELYPQHLSTDRLAAALHPQKDQLLTGMYSYFSEYTVFDRIPEAELPLLLEAIFVRSERPVPDYDQFHLKRFLGRLLANTVESQGDQVSTARLYGWLGLGLDEHDSPCLEGEQLARVAAWLSTHPGHYAPWRGTTSTPWPVYACRGC